MYNSFVAGYCAGNRLLTRLTTVFFEVAGDQRLDLERILSFY